MNLETTKPGSKARCVRDGTGSFVASEFIRCAAGSLLFARSRLCARHFPRGA
jgi:hypothetical protein